MQVGFQLTTTATAWMLVSVCVSFVVSSTNVLCGVALAELQLSLVAEPMPLLYYWERDQFLKDNAGKLIPGELTLSQGSEAFGRGETGERMWVFTRDCGHPARYVLAAQVIVDHIGEGGKPLGPVYSVCVRHDDPLPSR